jgi:anthranilate phosphoribosyltransferase
MDGNATAAQAGALLAALALKGETVAEVTAFAHGMRRRVTPVSPRRFPLLDTCGTGGSAFRVFNVSTAAALIATAAGATVAKHGNRAMSGICGSADVLEALGVNITLSPAQIAECIDRTGIGFLFAQTHHPAMKNVGPIRRELGARTIFNLLGPLSNPAGATRQVMGVYQPHLCGLVARVLQNLGSERVIVMHGDVGLDEISTIGSTQVSELREGAIVDYVLHSEDLGLDGPEPDPADFAPLPTPAENAALLRDVLTVAVDDKATRARRDLVAVNAAASLRVWGVADAWPDAVRLARRVIAEGEPLAVLARLVEVSNSV